MTEDDVPVKQVRFIPGEERLNLEYADVIVGAYGYDNSRTDEGRAYVFYGGGGAGLSRRPRQLDSVGIKNTGILLLLMAWLL